LGRSWGILPLLIVQVRFPARALADKKQQDYCDGPEQEEIHEKRCGGFSAKNREKGPVQKNQTQEEQEDLKLRLS
jgi:hypothetical protein